MAISDQLTTFPGRPQEGTNINKLPIPLEYDPNMGEDDKQYWESLGFNFYVPEPKEEPKEGEEKKPKLKGTSLSIHFFLKEK